MKTRTFFLLGLALFALGCADSKMTSTATTTSAHTYTYTNGACYDSTAATYVATSYCMASTTTTGYSWVNGACYASSTGQYVATSYCMASTTTTSSSSGAVPCSGYYVSTANGVAQIGICNASNCHGYTLIEYSTGRTVTCI